MDLKRLKFTIVPYLIWAVLSLICLTCRVRWHGREHFDHFVKNKKPVIFGMWHNCSTLASWAARNTGCVVVVSDSRDGEYVARLAQLLGNKTVRGSTSSGAKRLSLAMLRLLKSGESIAITPDGPRGPRYQVQNGVIWLASTSGEAILPFHVELDRSWKLNSWDKQIFPKPFANLHVGVGEPFYLDKELAKNDPEAAKLIVCRTLMENARRVQQAAGIELEYSPTE